MELYFLNFFESNSEEPFLQLEIAFEIQNNRYVFKHIGAKNESTFAVEFLDKLMDFETSTIRAFELMRWDTRISEVNRLLNNFTSKIEMMPIH